MSHDDHRREADLATDQTGHIEPYTLAPPIITTGLVQSSTGPLPSPTASSSNLDTRKPSPELESFKEEEKVETEYADESTVGGSGSHNGSQSAKNGEAPSGAMEKQPEFNEKASNSLGKPQQRPQSVRMSSDGHGHGEKKAIDDAGAVVDLEGEKVFLGTEALTGKAIIKDKAVLAGGPYTAPRYHHSLPLPFFKPKHPPPPPPDSLDDAKPLPDAKANIFSLITFSWITNIMALGAARQLAPEDLYRLPPDREADALSNKLQSNFQQRWDAATEYNIKLEAGEIKVPWKKRMQWFFGKGPEKGKTKADKLNDWRTRTGKKEPNLAWALTDVFGLYFWSAGILKVIADLSQVMTSLLIKAIIRFSTDHYQARINGTSGPNIGRGIGMCIGLLSLLTLSTLCMNHFFMRSSGVGVLARASLISALFERAINLTNRSRIQHPNGKLVNHISTDVSRIDFAAGMFHMVWTAPIQFLVVVVILLVQIKASALVGIVFLLILSPGQTMIIKHLFVIRKKAMVWTDKRARLLQELLSGMKVVKLMAWEKPFLKRLDGIRQSELKYIRKLMVTRSANMAIAVSIPVIAAILSFVTYASTGGDLDPATLFTVLTLFQLLRMPLMIYPMTLSAITDAYNALQRLSAVFTAEVFAETRIVDENSPYAVKIEGATFSWDSSEKPVPENPKAKKGGFGGVGGKGGKDGQPGRARRIGDKVRKPFRWIKNKKTGKIEVAQQMHAEIAAGKPGLQEAGVGEQIAEPGLSEGMKAETDGEPLVAERVFQLHNVNLEIPRNCFIAVVGEIGSGKSSLLSALFGEMRRTEGKVLFGGTSATCSQVPWICNATVRENILFGRPFEEERYWDVIHQACLETDLDLLPNGDAETIGEKGVNLSGGQKARVNIARAIYHQADVTAFDDPLAAVDPGIASLLFEAIANMSGTRILVTHAIHLVPACDYIITMHDGEIAERGTFEELKTANGAFAHLMREFANDGKKEVEEEAIEVAAPARVSLPRERMTANLSSTLMSSEVVHTGNMGSKTYGGWLKAANGWVTVPLLLLAVTASQALIIITSYWLVYWQEDQFNRDYSFYEGLYVLLGLGSAFALFLMGAVQALAVFRASVRLHDGMITRIMHAPSSWYDTTPLGRILNRLTKDIDTLDNTLGDAMRMAITTAASIVGAVVLIAIVEPYFLIAVFVIFCIYGQLAWWYQKSALAFKRIDGVLRSPLYAHFSESLAGVAVIRSFDASDRFIADNCRYMSIENRAYYLTVVNQRWLAIRLDFLGSLLTFTVGIIVVVGTDRISPAQGGLILSYMITVQQSFSWLCRQVAEVINDMASAERVLEYTHDLDQEAAHEIPETKPPANWPSQGKIKFEHVTMGYRPELPAVLKDLNLDVGVAEKIAVVGRTGAGKSTIMSTLYRLVELRGGSIKIDDIDISTIGLYDLRSALSIIPQEAVLFSGTIRTNIDPFGEKTDAELWDALRRAHLVDSQTSELAIRKSMTLDGTASPDATHTPTSRFTLDTQVDEDGSNFSAGERSLVSLARALVRDAKIVVLDEATAAVDLATDAKIQQTIRHEFKNKTLLCIAHRLRTILYYDRVLVMSAGEVAEFDTPENLFLQGGAFAEMCEKSNIDLQEIRQAATLRS